MDHEGQKRDIRRSSCSVLKLTWDCIVVAYLWPEGPVVNLYMTCLMRGPTVRGDFRTRIIAGGKLRAVITGRYGTNVISAPLASPQPLPWRETSTHFIFPSVGRNANSLRGFH